MAEHTDTDFETAVPQFVPPDPPDAPDRRRRRRRLWRAALALLLLAGSGGGWWWHRTDKAADLRVKTAAAERARVDAARCPGVDRLSTGDYALARPGGSFGEQCLGWTVTADYPFGSTVPEVKSLISTIVAANQKVRDAAQPYVRIAVMMPMTWQTGGALSEREIIGALRGAAVAQHAANLPGTRLRDGVPQIQLVLANIGTDQTGWAGLKNPPADRVPFPGIVAELGALAHDREHPLVAVTGLGISDPTTRDAATALAGYGLPAIGAVISATDMTAPTFFKVSPSNLQYADALDAWLTAARAGGVRLDRAMLVFDRNPDDNYVRTLREALLAVFGARFDLPDHQKAFTGSKSEGQGVPELFAPIVDDVCASHPQLIFYAGRDRDLGAFVTALKARGRCGTQVEPLVIATGASGLTLTAAAADQAKLGLVDASSTDIAGWQAVTGTAPPGFADFVHDYTARPPAGLGLPAASLGDGYAAMHYDAVAVAVWATRVAMSDGAAPTAVPPLGVDVRNALFSLDHRRLPGASGSIFFVENEKQGFWPRHKPIPIITLGAVADALPRGALYYTP